MRRREFDAKVQEALGKIPPIFRDAMQNLQIVVEDWPDPDLMEDEFDDQNEVVYGLFIGTPLPLRGAGDWGNTPDLIYLYRGPLEEDFPNPKDLAKEIEITLVHEIAHYMGFDEDVLEEYGYE